MDEVMNSAIPEFGSNPVEGTYAKARLGYYKSEKYTGYWDIHFLEKLGQRYGVNNSYKLSQSQRGQVRLHYLTGLGGRVSYGWQHRVLLGVPYKSRMEIIDDFFKGVLPPSNSQYPEFVIDVTSRELVNYEWISYKPKLTLYTPSYTTFNTDWYSRFSIYGADIYEEGREEGNKRFFKGFWDYNLSKTYDFGGYGDLVPSIIYSKTGYYDFGRLSGAWKRFYYNLDYYKDFWKFKLRTGYKNTFEESGFSPFEFDTFNVSTKEETNYTVFYQVSERLKLSYHEDYSITEKKLRDNAYGLSFKYCCWNIGLTWYDAESKFIFDISL
jgi:hypothetical protein